MLTNIQFRMNLNVKESENTINQRIAKIAEDLKYYPAAFAKHINVPRQKVSNVLEGKFEPKADILISISKSFPKLNTRWLLTGEGNMWHSDIEKDQVSEISEKYIKQPKDNISESINNQISTIKNDDFMESELVLKLVSLLEKQQEDMRYALTIQHMLASKISNLGEGRSPKVQAG